MKSNDRTNPNKRNIIKWDNVSYGKGGSIVAVALNKGSEVARHAVETAGKAVSLQVETENKDWKADGMSLQYIRVYAVDSKNRRMELASNNVKFTVTGEASLLAVDNGDHYTDSVFTHDSCQMLDGFAMAILRSTMRAGRVNVKITADGLKPVTFKLVTGR